MVYTEYLKSLRKVSLEPSFQNIPPLRYFLVDGEGDPNNSESFDAAIQLLYAASYAVRMSQKSGWAIPGYELFKVGPLEGFWWVEGGKEYSLNLSRSEWRWSIGIPQPDFVTENILTSTVDALSKKKPNLDITRLRTEEIQEGTVAQLLHLGPYSDEPASLQKLDTFVKESGRQYCGKHHEIYLSDPRRGDPSKLKTILRHPVE